MPINTKYLVDPQLFPTLELFPARDLSTEVLAQVRDTPIPVLFQSPEENAAVDIASHVIPGPSAAPEIGVTVYTPHLRRAEMPCILHIHGGGYVFGSAAIMDPMHRKLAVAANCTIVAVDYRLAPETCYPGAIEDCYAALTWTYAQARSLGIDPRRIGVMGESAGGGLAAALALLARDRGEYALAFQHLIYPMLDDRTCLATEPNPYAGEFVWTPQNNVFGWSALLGTAPGSEGVSAYAAPARATTLADLPRTFISTGALDLFVDENLEYARRLIRQAVPVELHVYPGAFHAFDMSVDARVAKQAQQDSLMALRRVLAVQ